MGSQNIPYKENWRAKWLHWGFLLNVQGQKIPTLHKLRKLKHRDCIGAYIFNIQIMQRQSEKGKLEAYLTQEQRFKSTKQDDHDNKSGNVYKGQ